MHVFLLCSIARNTTELTDTSVIVNVVEVSHLMHSLYTYENFMNSYFRMLLLY